MITSKSKGWGVMISLFFLFAGEFWRAEIRALPTSSCRWTRSSASRHQHGLGKTLLGHLHMSRLDKMILTNRTESGKPHVLRPLVARPRGSVYYAHVPPHWAPHADRCFVGFCGDCMEERFRLSPRHGQSFAGCSQERGIQRKSTFTAKFCGSSSFTRILYLWIGTYIQDRYVDR